MEILLKAAQIFFIFILFLTIFFLIIYLIFLFCFFNIFFCMLFGTVCGFVYTFALIMIRYICVEGGGPEGRGWIALALLTVLYTYL